jgi:hypothetical protein
MRIAGIFRLGQDGYERGDDWGGWGGWGHRWDGWGHGWGDWGHGLGINLHLDL